MAGEPVGMWWAFILLGLGAGILSGSLGVGSGLLLIPVLVLVCALPQKSAQGTALAVMVPMALLGATRYWLNPDIEVNLKIVGLIVAGALVGVLIGTAIVDRMPGKVLRTSFAIYVIIVGLRMLIPSSPASPKAPSAPEAQASNRVAENVTDREVRNDVR